MIYWACREAVSYLDYRHLVLNPNTIIAIIGGFGFFHFINKDTQRIVLIDKNPDQIVWFNIVRKIIESSSSIDDFISVMHGKELTLPSEEKKVYDLYVDNIKNIFFDTLKINELGTYSWGFGHGAFTNNDTFLILKEKLSCITDVLCSKAEDVDYGKYQSKELCTNILMSNAEYSFYGSVGIRDRVKDTIIYPARYFTWGFTGDFKPNKNYFNCLIS